MCFQTRFKGKTLYLYFGRGAVYQGFDFSESKIPAGMRIQDRYLQFARKYWRGMRLLKLTVSKKDKVLSLYGVKEGRAIAILFFWRGRDLFFAHEITGEVSVELFQSWEGKQTLPKEAYEKLDLSDIFNGLGFDGVETRDKLNDFSIEEYLDTLTREEEVGEAVRNKKRKTLEKMKEELKRFDVLDYLERKTGEDLENVKSIGDGRFKVRFTGIEGHFKKRELLFNKIKAWRKSQNMLRSRVDDLTLDLGKSGQKKKVLYKGKIVEPVWNFKVQKKELQKKEKYIEFIYREVKCYLGRTALENDFIRKELAKKDDWWIHLEGYKSGHLFVKNEINELLPRDLEILASALVELNGLSLREIPIIFTQVKNLKGVKGIAGMVNYKKEKHLTVYFDQKWRQKLSNIEVD